MPHLGPLSWSMSLIFFWILLVSLCSLVWWMKGVEVGVEGGYDKGEGGKKFVVLKVWEW